MAKKSLALVCTAILLVFSLLSALPLVSAESEWAPKLGIFAVEKNYDATTLPLMGAPYSFGYYGDGGNTRPVANSGGNVAYTAASAYWLILPAAEVGYGRYALAVAEAEIFTIKINAKKAAGAAALAWLPLSTVIWQVKRIDAKKGKNAVLQNYVPQNS